MNNKQLLAWILAGSMVLGTCSWPADVPQVPPTDSSTNNESFVSTPVVVGGVALGLSALIMGIKFLLHTKNKEGQQNHIGDIAIRDLQTLNRVSLKGISYSRSGVDIVQLPVATQQGLSCGYHSLKNGILIAQGLLKSHSKLCQQLVDSSYADQLFGYSTKQSIWLNRLTFGAYSTNPWREYLRTHIKNAGHYNSVVDDISSNAVEMLINLEQKKHYLMDKSCSYDVIALDDIRVIGCMNGPNTENRDPNNNLYTADFITPPVKEKMRNAQRSNSTYACVFLVNTGHQFDNKAGKSTVTMGNHWFTVVLFVQGAKHTYVGTDSLNNVSRISSNGRTVDHLLQRLVNTLEDKNIIG